VKRSSPPPTPSGSDPTERAPSPSSSSSSTPRCHSRDIELSEGLLARWVSRPRAGDCGPATAPAVSPARNAPPEGLFARDRDTRASRARRPAALPRLRVSCCYGGRGTGALGVDGFASSALAAGAFGESDKDPPGVGCWPFGAAVSVPWLALPPPFVLSVGFGEDARSCTFRRTACAPTRSYPSFVPIPASRNADTVSASRSSSS